MWNCSQAPCRCLVTVNWSSRGTHGTVCSGLGSRSAFPASKPRSRTSWLCYFGQGFMELWRELTNYIYQTSTLFMGDAQGMLTVKALYDLLLCFLLLPSPLLPFSHCALVEPFLPSTLVPCCLLLLSNTLAVLESPWPSEPVFPEHLPLCSCPWPLLVLSELVPCSTEPLRPETKALQVVPSFPSPFPLK